MGHTMAKIARLWIVASVWSSPAFAQPLPDTVFPGELALQMPFLGTDTVDSYKVVGNDRTQTNRYVRTVERAVEQGRAVIRITTDHTSAASGEMTRNVLVIDAADLSLIRHDVRAPADSASVACDSSNHITGWNKLPDRDMIVVNRSYGRRVFPDDGIGPWLFGMLPLQPGYRAMVPQFNPWSGEERFTAFEVVGEEELSNGKVKIPCWIIRIVDGPGPPGYKQQRWIAKSSRRPLKGVASRGPDDPEFSSVTRHWF